jgi:hypothetical protein
VIDKPLVRVVWNDAEDSDGTWSDESEVEAFANHDCTVESVGFLVSKTDKYVTLAGDWIPHTKQHGRVTKIPAGMVGKIEPLNPEG